MDDKIAQLILDELFSSLEIVEAQSTAILELLKEKHLASDEELARYLEQAGLASSVKRRAARARIDHLVSGITNPPKKATETESAKAEEKKGGEEKTEEEKTEEKKTEPAPQANVEEENKPEQAEAAIPKKTHDGKEDSGGAEESRKESEEESGKESGKKSGKKRKDQDDATDTDPKPKRQPPTLKRKKQDS